MKDCTGISGILLNIKKANLNQFLELNNILFLTSMCVKMYYFNTKHVVEKTTNQLISIVELLSFHVNKVYINVCTQ